MKRLLHFIFGLFNAVKSWTTRRFTTAGWMVVFGLVASAVIGLDTKQTMAYQAFTFLLSLLLFSMLWGLFFRSRFTGRRKLPRFGSVGEPLVYRIVIENKSSKRQVGLSLFENVADPHPTLKDFIETTEPWEKTRNLFDKTVGYHKWVWLLSRKQIATFSEHRLSSLPVRGEQEVRVEIIPKRRGYLRFTGMAVARPDPFGLFKSLVTIPEAQSLLILPRRYSVPPIQLPGSRKYQPGGVALTSNVGDTEEFHSLREYRPGDPLRKIYWKGWAKMDKPIVKEYQDEFFVRHALILDTFQEREYSESLEEAVSVAASFVCTIETHESLLDLMFVGTEAYCFTSGRGLAHVDKLLEILASVQGCQEKSFRDLSHLALQRSALLSGCICILLSWDEEKQDLVGRLQGLRIPILVLVIREEQAESALDPGPMKSNPDSFHTLRVGEIKEALAHL